MSTEISVQSFSDFDGAIVNVLNPNASSMAEATATRGDIRYMHRQMGTLVTEYHRRMQYVQTTEKPDTTRDEILDNLNPGDVIVVWGGDGSVNLVGDLIRNDPDLDDELRSTPVLAVMAGNANLGASELTPKVRGKRPNIVDVLKHGKVIDTWGSSLTTTSDHPDYTDPEETSALFCHSVQVGGLVGNALEEIRAHKLRTNKIGRGMVDGLAVLKAVMGSEFIPMKINGQEVDGIGSIGVNSGVYLKLVGTPASVSERAYYELTVADNTLRYLGRSLARHFISELPWRRVEADESLTYDLVAAPGQQLFLETDAEPRRLPVQPDNATHITVDVRQHDVPVRMFSTNPRLVRQ